MKTYRVNLIVTKDGIIVEEDCNLHNNYDRALQSQARMLESAKEDQDPTCEVSCTIEEINNND